MEEENSRLGENSTGERENETGKADGVWKAGPRAGQSRRGGRAHPLTGGEEVNHFIMIASHFRPYL